MWRKKLKTFESGISKIYHHQTIRSEAFIVERNSDCYFTVHSFWILNQSVFPDYLLLLSDVPADHPLLLLLGLLGPGPGSGL